MPRTLDELTDEMNARIHAFEEAANKAGIHVPAGVQIDDNNRLEMLKSSKTGFYLALVSVSTAGTITTPLCSTSREMRIKCVEKLPALVQKLKEAQQTEIERVRSALDILDGTIRAVGCTEGE